MNKIVRANGARAGAMEESSARPTCARLGSVCKHVCNVYMGEPHSQLKRSSLRETDRLIGADSRLAIPRNSSRVTSHERPSGYKYTTVASTAQMRTMGDSFGGLRVFGPPCGQRPSNMPRALVFPALVVMPPPCSLPSSHACRPYSEADVM